MKNRRALGASSPELVTDGAALAACPVDDARDSNEMSPEAVSLRLEELRALWKMTLWLQERPSLASPQGSSR